MQGFPALPTSSSPTARQARFIDFNKGLPIREPGPEFNASSTPDDRDCGYSDRPIFDFGVLFLPPIVAVAAGGFNQQLAIACSPATSR
jgi:hypothetical protein